MKPPVIIVDYDPDWPRRYGEERVLILETIGEYIASVEHIGSTSVPDLAAKPIIDIMAGLARLDDALHCVEPLSAVGYEYVPEYETQMPDRRYFRKGPERKRTHHLHMVELNGDFWTRHLLFRDYLRAHPEQIRAYADLKRVLAARYGRDREGYTNAKSEFVEGVLRTAIREIDGR